MKKTILITGASSGIGRAAAQVLGREGNRLIICGRREERLNSLQEELNGLAEVHLLTFDVRDRNAVEKALQSLPEDFHAIHVLINNAGNAHGLEPIGEGNPDDWDAMIDINVKGLLYVSRAIIPQMMERKEGHIINIGSIAAKEVYPKGNVYCASKHAVDAITKGMLQDLNPYNIKVSGIHPGMVETEFSEVRFKGDKERAKKVYEGVQPLRAEDIAEILSFLISRPAHVNISDLVVLATAQANATLVQRNVEHS